MNTIALISLLFICWNMLSPIVAKLFGYKVDSSKLYCGLVGFCSDKPADKGNIRTLLMYNQERGEDSTGWAMNNIITKENDNVKKFLTKNKLHFSTQDTNFTFIAHARKASSGGKFNKELAHPFGIYKDGTEKDDYDLILAMNGTMTNTLEFAKEFGMEYKVAVNSDTQILARTIAKLGEKEYIKALEGYDGTATLLFFTPRFNNTLMVFKDPERPLFYWNKTPHEMYISSLEESLVAIGAEELDVKSFEDNTLYRITKGKITKQTKIERKPIKKEVITYYGGYGGMYSKNAVHGGGQQTKFLNSNNNNGNIDLFKIELLNRVNKSGNHVYCMIDRYYRNGHPINDNLWLNVDGKIGNINEEGYKEYFFVNGYMLKDKTSYENIKVKCNENNTLSLQKFKDFKLSQLCEDFAQPSMTIVDGIQKFLLNAEWSKKVKASNDTFTFKMPFTNILTEITWKGKCVEISDDNKELIRIVRVCDVTSIKEDIAQIPDTTEPSETKTKSFVDDIKKLIKESPNIGVEELYNRLVLSKWQSNRTDKVRAMFFKKLLKTFLADDILSQDSYNDLLIKGVDSGWGNTSKGFTNEVQFCVQYMRNHIKKEEELSNTILNTHVDGNEDLVGNQISIFDKEIANNEKAIFENLESSNTYFNNEEFKKDFYDVDYKDLAAFSKDWVCSTSNFDNEFRQFCEAILLALELIGKITATEVVTASELTDKELQLCTETKYLEYMEEWSTKSKNDKDDVTDVIVEDLSKEENEENVVNDFNDLRDTIYQSITEMDMVPESERTETFTKILDIYCGIYAEHIKDTKFSVK